MSSNKRRRCSDDYARSSSSKFAAIESSSTMFISLPPPSLPKPAARRRSPLTPPSVTPPSVSVAGCSTMQAERDRCRSPSQRARVLLEKVAVVGSVPSAPPSSPRMCGTTSPARSIGRSVSSAGSTPLSTPPDEHGGHFPYMYYSCKGLLESHDGGYVSFPVFEEFGDCKSDDEDSVGSPSRR